MSDLQEAVDALTEPVIEHIAQTGDDGKWLRAHSVEHPPLLRQLADAINPSKNSGPGTPATPATRSIVNFEAMFLHAKISSEIKSWCLIRKVKPVRPVDRIRDLQAWADSRNRRTLLWRPRRIDPGARTRPRPPSGGPERRRVTHERGRCLTNARLAVYSNRIRIRSRGRYRPGNWQEILGGNNE